jgi:NADH-quinone oxidoreductase subunit I
MPVTIKRPDLTWSEKLYLPAIAGGFVITIRHFFRTCLSILGFKKPVTLQYPEEKWQVPQGYRGAPTLVRDQAGREKCVGCQLCEFVCPPRAITVFPGEIAPNSPTDKVEKYAEEFKIDMLRCIYCGLCEEVCPEQAIFLKQEYAFVGSRRADLVHDKKRLLELGGIHQDHIQKWNHK